MRGNTLEELRNMVRSEARQSTSFTRGNDQIEYIDQLINRYYEQFYNKYEWPSKRIHKEDATIQMQAGERYYDFPDLLDIECISTVSRRYGNIWGDIVQGIVPTDFTAMNSDDGFRADPIIKWDIYDERQFEVWPVPASNSQLIRFDGYKKLNRLVANDSRCELDGILISLFAAAEVLAAQGQKDAAAKSAAAAERLSTLTARLATKTRIGFIKPRLGRRGPLRIRVPLVRS